MMRIYWVRSKFTISLPCIVALAAGIAVTDGDAARSQAISQIKARVIATGIPGASAISQVGKFLNNPVPPACANPIPNLFPQYTVSGAVLDPKRILVGSVSNFGAPGTLGQDGSFLSIDPSGPGILKVPPNFAQSIPSAPPPPPPPFVPPIQPSALGGAVQMFSANSPQWLNGVNNPLAKTASYTGVSNPLGLSNNNAFGRLWPANAPFGDSGVGSSSILDPTGLPLASPPATAPNKLIGGVYVGNQTNRDVVTTQLSQVIAGSLSTGAVGTAFLGPSPDGTCKAVFSVVTADGAIVQEHTLKGLDGIAPAGTVQPLLGRSWDPPNQAVEPRLGVLMNPYTGAAPQLFVSEPFNNTIAVLNLVTFGTAADKVFSLGSVTRITSQWLNLPVDLAPVQRDLSNPNWASNTTLDEDSGFYVANRGDNTIVRMSKDGTAQAIRRVTVDDHGPWDNGSLNGIATSTDGMTIYVTYTGPGRSPGGVLALPAF
jgi:hypothetical protein